MFERTERGYALVDLNAIRENVRLISKRTGGKPIAAVLKADGYGHGAVSIGKALEEMPEIAFYATATAEEAAELRSAGLKKPILVLNYTFPYTYPDVVRYGIRIAAFREDELAELNEVAGMIGKKAIVHIKLDTGMGRIGIMPDDSGVRFVKDCLDNYKNIEIEGIFSHFAKADEADKTSALSQIAKFRAFNERLKNELGLDIKIKHIANSAAICDIDEAYFDMCRAGIVLYGLEPSSDVNIKDLGIRPALSLYSHIIYVKDCEPGATISYGSTYVCSDKRKVATIPIGYADGYPRSLSGKGYVLIRGAKAPILGRICMDQFMVDVTDIPDVKEGDLVTLIGRDGDNEIRLDDISALSDRFNYEFVCCITKRIPRLYEG